MPVKPSKKTAAPNIPALIDELGNLKAQMADLKEREETIREELVKAKVQEAEGSLFKVSFTKVETERMDWKKFQDDYDLPPLDDYKSKTVSTRMNVTTR